MTVVGPAATRRVHPALSGAASIAVTVQLATPPRVRPTTAVSVLLVTAKMRVSGRVRTLHARGDALRCATDRSATRRARG
mmetsp:Transcript_67970/g.79051  ORF Transcript_67970/g.79051 Transcript_67970/m.79051 type:complete len:80 (+) Transcript_67970:156-395(+)